MRNELILRVTLTPSCEDGSPRSGASATREYRFSTLPIAIGRSPGNDLEIASQFVSSSHVRIEEVSGALCVRDLGSRNGVVVQDGCENVRIPSNVAYPVSRVGFELQLGNEARVRIEPALERAAPEQPFPLRRPPPLAPSSSSPRPRTSAEPERVSPRVENRRHSSGLKTEDFELPREALAFQGLRELVASLTPGGPLETRGEIARLITRLHDLLQVLCESYLALRDAPTKFIANLGLQRSLERDPTRAALAAAREPRAVAALLLDVRAHAHDPASALAAALSEIRAHQVALLDRMTQGIHSLLAELEPEQIRQQLEASPGSDERGRAEQDCWEEYCERHARLARDGQAIARVFGQEFASAYQAHRRSRRRGAS